MSARYQPPKLRDIAVGILLVVALILLVGVLPQAVKVAGYPFLIIPSSLGLIRVPSADQVQTLSLAKGQTAFYVSDPGQYAIFTGDGDLLTINEAALAVKAAPWLVVRRSGTGENVPMAFVERGTRPYDTPLAPGRPVFTFTAPDPGFYEIRGPRRPASLAVLPDYATGRERVFALTYVVEIAVVLLPVAIVYYRRRRAAQAQLKAEQARRRQQSDDFWRRQAEKRTHGAGQS